MPGLNFFNRRWNIASDDLFYPGLIELILRSLWFLPQFIYYIKYQYNFQCSDVELLHVYYLGFLCMMLAILLVVLGITVISSRGTITNNRPRRHMAKFIYLRVLCVFVELGWSILGAVWLSKIQWATCSFLIYSSVLANLIFSMLAVLILSVASFILLDPISHLPEEDVAKKRNVLYDHLKKILCCCYCCLHMGSRKNGNEGNSRRPNYENSYKQISSILEMIFRNGDLTPSDIGAGLILLSNKQVDQFNRESHIMHRKIVSKSTKKLDVVKVEQIAKWMNVNEAAYFIRYALATYSWPYYLYMHNVRGCFDLCCTLNNSDGGCCLMSCCCCVCCSKAKSASVGAAPPELVIDNQPKSMVIHGDTRCQRHLRAFKFLSKIDECDLIYANFQNELFLSPFCIIVDHFKKSVVITIRGTLSMRDVITDMTAECGFFDVEHLLNQPCHIGILSNAENIYDRIKTQNLLVEAFRFNPNYQLLVTGHSLGAGTAVILSLKLKKEYPNVKCIAYSPPGGLISEALSDYTKSFVMSVVLGDDIVPRLSLHSVHSLKADILKEIYNTNLPKYKIIWKYSVSFVKAPKRKDPSVLPISSTSSSEIESDNEESTPKNSLDNSLNSDTSRNILLQTANDEDLIKLSEDNQQIEKISVARIGSSKYDEKRLSAAAAKAILEENTKLKANALHAIKSNIVDLDDFQDKPNSKPKEKSSIVAGDLIKKMMHHVKQTYPDLHLPGNVLYIYQIKAYENEAGRNCFTRCLPSFLLCGNKKLIDYDSRWASRDEFKKILVTNRMLIDHFPNTVDDALNYFHSTNRFYV